MRYVIRSLFVFALLVAPSLSGAQEASDGAAEAAAVPLTVHVRDASSHAVADVTVSLFRHRDEDLDGDVLFAPGAPPALTSSAGAVSLEVEPGTYDIVLTGPIVPQQIRKRIDSRVHELEIAVDRGVAISGRVLFNDGSPVPAKTAVSIERSGPEQTVLTDDRGRFGFPHVQRGRLTLRARWSNRFSITGPPVEIRAPASDVVLRLRKPARLEGQVIAREARRGVGQFSLEIERLDGDGEAVESFNAQRTVSIADGDGRFSIEVPPGLMRLTVTAPGFAEAAVTGLRLREGQRSAHLEVQLERESRIAGRVTDMNGAPLADAAVVLHREEVVVPRRSATRTDARGDYVLDGVTAGTYEILFSHPGFYRTRAPAEVSIGATAHVDVQLRPGIEVTGVVVDERGQPLPDVTIRILSACCNGITQTRADGTFVASGLEEGRYVLTADRKGYIHSSTSIVIPGEPLRIVLERGGVLTGVIRGVGERDRARLTVEARKPGSRVWGEVDPVTGEFRIEGISDGKVSVIASTGNNDGDSVSEDVEVREGVGGPVQLDFSSGLTISGRVTGHGQGLDGTVYFMTQKTASFFPQAFSTVDGRYTAKRIAAGRCRVWFQTSNGETLFNEEILLTGDRTLDLELRGARMHGRVRDGVTGEPIAGASVLVSADANGTVRRAAVTDGGGAFNADFLPEGRYRITVQARGYAPGEWVRNVGAGEEAAFEAELDRGDAVVIRIVDAVTQRPVPATVTLLDESRKAVLDARADPGGVLRAWLRPGSYTMNVFGGEAYAEQRDLPVTVPTPEVTVLLREGGTLVIEARTLQPFQARLMVHDVFFRSLAGDGQRTVLRHLPAGDYVLQVFPNGDPGKKTEHSITIVEGKATTVTID